MKNYILAFKNIFNFKGEATLNEFWSFFMVNLLVTLLLVIAVKKLAVPEELSTFYRILSFVVSFSIGFRRLRNAGLSGWLFLIPFVNLFFASLPEKETTAV